MTTKRFALTYADGERHTECDFSLDRACFLGWGFAHRQRGREELNALEVGQTTTDLDGDTWERTA